MTFTSRFVTKTVQPLGLNRDRVRRIEIQAGIQITESSLPELGVYHNLTLSARGAEKHVLLNFFSARSLKNCRFLR
jgi:hypothetical protein